MPNIKHQLTGHYLYTTWKSMRDRCLCPTNEKYDRYGGRGITICDRWSDFALFLEDMGERPPGHTLDRVDNDGNYEPDNCRWATPAQQTSNQRLTCFTSSNPHRCIYPLKSGYHIAITLVPKTTVHRKSFNTLQEAIDYRDECDYERTFHRILGI